MNYRENSKFAPSYSARSSFERTLRREKGIGVGQEATGRVDIITRAMKEIEGRLSKAARNAPIESNVVFMAPFTHQNDGSRGHGFEKSGELRV